VDESGQRRGRRRDSRIDHTVLEATRELLTELGYAGLTVDAVAARAGVGKAAIYRRFGSKAEMVFAAAVHDLDIKPPRNTGSLRGDLYAMARLIHTRMASAAAAQAAPALVAELARDPALVQRFQQTFLAKERADFTTVLDRAVRRGELTTRPDPELVHLMLAGPHFAALFAFHIPVDDALLRQFATVIAAGLIQLGR
jgi:AcrR family transcriptional regulator